MIHDSTLNLFEDAFTNPTELLSSHPGLMGNLEIAHNFVPLPANLANLHSLSDVHKQPCPPSCPLCQPTTPWLADQLATTTEQDFHAYEKRATTAEQNATAWQQHAEAIDSKLTTARREREAWQQRATAAEQTAEQALSYWQQRAMTAEQRAMTSEQRATAAEQRAVAAEQGNPKVCDIDFPRIVPQTVTGLRQMLEKSYELSQKLHKEIERRTKCQVCMDAMCDTILNCGHQFCGECANRVFQCPLCRAAIFNRIRIRR